MVNEMTDEPLNYDKNYNLTKTELEVLKELQSPLGIRNDYVTNNVRCMAIKKTSEKWAEAVEKLKEEIKLQKEGYTNSLKNNVNKTTKRCYKLFLKDLDYFETTIDKIFGQELSQ